MGCIPVRRFRISVCAPFKANVVRKQSVVCSDFEHNLHCGDDDDVIKIMLAHFRRRSSILLFPPVAPLSSFSYFSLLIVLHLYPVHSLPSCHVLRINRNRLKCRYNYRHVLWGAV